jgi:hypothetical protein
MSKTSSYDNHLLPIELITIAPVGAVITIAKTAIVRNSLPYSSYSSRYSSVIANAYIASLRTTPLTAAYTVVFGIHANAKNKASFVVNFGV